MTGPDRAGPDRAGRIPEPGGVSRRAFTTGAVAVTGLAAGLGAGLAVVGCTGSGASTASAYRGDLRIAALAVALENEAVSVYRALLAAARAGRLGRDTGALTGLARTCLRQHSEHAMTWNAVLRAGHAPTITGIPLAGHQLVMTRLGRLDSVSETSMFAASLEARASQTFVAAAGRLRGPVSIATAAGIAPVEAMHAAMFRLIVGEYPVPDSFAGTTGAVGLRDLTV